MTSKIETGSKIEITKLNDYFKFPIYYNDKKMDLNKNIIEDLELIKTINADDNTKSIYQYTFQPQTIFGLKTLEQIPHYYTTDVDFLKDTQQLLKKYIYKKDAEEHKTQLNLKQLQEEALELWDELKNDTGFKERYHYIDWTMWEFLNKSELFLQLMSIYNMISPVLSLLVPIIILIVPFFIIKMKGLNITMNEYIQVLKLLASNHAIGKIFTDFNNVGMNEKVYILLSSFFYLFSI